MFKTARSHHLFFQLWEGREEKPTHSPRYFQSHSLILGASNFLLVTVIWVRRKLIFALSKSVVLCVHGSRTPWVKDSFTESVSNCENNKLFRLRLLQIPFGLCMDYRLQGVKK